MRGRFAKITLSVLFILSVSALHAAAGTDALEPPAKLSASLDRESAHVGDSVVLTLKYYVPQGISFESMPKLEGLDGLTVIDKKMTEGEIKLTLLVDRVDKLEIGPVSLSYKDRDGIETIVRSEAVSLAVQSSLGDRPAEAQLKPIMDIMPVTPLWLRYLPWILGAVLIACAIFGFFWWKKRRRRMEELVAVRPPHIIAEEGIRELQAGSLFEKGQYKEFYFRLSEIIRRYIEDIRNFPAVEFTTEEIARRMRSDSDRRILPLLRQADLVKFADMVPTQARKDEDIGAALSYVRDTAPVVPAAGQAEAAPGGAG